LVTQKGFEPLAF